MPASTQPHVLESQPVSTPISSVPSTLSHPGLRPRPRTPAFRAHPSLQLPPPPAAAGEPQNPSLITSAASTGPCHPRGEAQTLRMVPEPHHSHTLQAFSHLPSPSRVISKGCAAPIALPRPCLRRPDTLLMWQTPTNSSRISPGVTSPRKPSLTTPSLRLYHLFPLLLLKMHPQGRLGGPVR